MKYKLVEELLPHCKGVERLLDRCEKLSRKFESKYEREHMSSLIDESRGI